ncbi:MAG: hypothetical protein CML67_04445 [Rhodobacteraceae bacterium]|nr:hypothetical protein [Paracoccaceae bacterium]
MNSAGQGVANFIGGLFGGKQKPAQQQSKATKARNATPRGQEVAAVRAEIRNVKATPASKPRERNLNAKLGGLNSLNRNVNAYLNANDPRMVTIREFIGNSIDYENALSDIETLERTVAEAREALDTALSGIDPSDDYSYEGKSLSELNERLGELNDIDQTTLSETEVETLEAEISALESALSSETAETLSKSEAELAELEGKIDDLEAAASDEALAEALKDMSNPGKNAGTDPDAEIDPEVLEWAKEVLGVGELDGRIDEVRAIREAEETNTDG